MKKIFLLFGLLTPFLLAAQKNNVKLNLTGLGAQLIGFQYEYQATKRIGLQSTFFYRNRSAIPFAEPIDNLAKSRGLGLTGIDFTYILMNKAELGVTGLSPEVRFYLSKKKNPAFIGLFGQYENFDLKVPGLFDVRYENFSGNVEMPVVFDIRTLSAGVLLGKRWQWNRLLLDFVVIGPHFGRATALNAKIEQEVLTRLSDADRTYLKEKVIERFGLSEEYFNVGIDGSSASIRSIKNIPYLGIRGIGINVGWRF